MSRKRHRSLSPSRMVARPSGTPNLASGIVPGANPSFAVRLVRTPRDVLPKLLNGSLASLLVRQPFKTTPPPTGVAGTLGKRVRNPLTRPQRKFAAQRQLQKLGEPSLPHGGHSNTCGQRAARRSVMFAGGVAGRGWSAGGPNMFRAKFGPESSYTCRR